MCGRSAPATHNKPGTHLRIAPDPMRLRSPSLGGGHRKNVSPVTQTKPMAAPHDTAELRKARGAFYVISAAFMRPAAAPVRLATTAAYSPGAAMYACVRAASRTRSRTVSIIDMTS
jgi:hypothetical protein